ncbi:MAG: hypothetical protein QHJ73_06215, partial [Armatimonadota bacterium]|nr:hypothetical protein [Armatimonadota bacterium]
VDLVHSSLNPGKACVWEFGRQRLEVTGEFALVTLDRRGVQRACLVSGTELRVGDFVLRAPPPFACRVGGVDFEQNGVWLERPLAVGRFYRDPVVIFENEGHSASYMIRSVRTEGDRTFISFGDTLFVVGMGHVEALDSAAGTVRSHEALAGYGRVDGGRHAGRWLYNEERSRGFRIKGVEKDTFLLESGGAALESVFTDADGDGRRRYWISDVGPGDRARIPSAVWVSRE